MRGTEITTPTNAHQENPLNHLQGLDGDEDDRRQDAEAQGLRRCPLDSLRAGRACSSWWYPVRLRWCVCRALRHGFAWRPVGGWS